MAADNIRGIRTENVTIGYDTDLIREICLEARPGRIVTLIGPNGCGKSTLLKTLTGELAARSGVVYLNGTDRKALDATEAAKQLSMVMTHRVRAELMTCGEVVALGRYPYTGRFGILSDEDRSKVREAMAWADVSDLRDAPFQNISDGQRQRVMLASAICREPEILILDEPTSYLDIRYKLDILDRIRRLAAEKNMAVIMSLHELEIAMRISDHVLALGEGKILKSGSCAEVFTEEFIRQLYHIEGKDTTLLGNPPWLEKTVSSPEITEPEDTGQSGVHTRRFADTPAQQIPAENGTRADASLHKAHVIMIQGTMSNAGKSVIAAGLCRIFHQDGYRVAPFKSQNMALNSCVTEEGLEMGRAQVMQAECAGIRPRVCMNPILLKPTDDMGSQVIVNGRVMGNMRAMAYFRRKKELIPEIRRAYEELFGDVDIIVVEGAGSPVELNLRKDDIVNMGLAEMIDAPVLLVGDIDRGGIFAQMLGTLDLLTPAERARVKGLIVNKFRGDPALFADGVRILAERGQKEVLGVVPWAEVHLDDEDSLSDRFRPGKPGVIDIAVVRLPHISNYTDFDTFEQLSEVSVRYVTAPEELLSPDMIILPGTKNTIGDLAWLRQTGLAAHIRQEADAGRPVMGICGGYQMLGRCISDPEHAECGGTAEGLCLLPVETRLGQDKKRTLFHGRIEGASGVLQALCGREVSGYEIHMGVTTVDEGTMPFTSGGTGCCRENVYGSYIHGLFDQKEILETLVRSLAARKGKQVSMDRLLDYAAYRETQYDLLAAHLRRHLDMAGIYGILGLKDPETEEHQ
ncbi:MAG: cobyric acid synthase [Butyrivibrio sp.]|nr:cobyric acid synthase [Butyrivibrio sp.]